MVYICIMALLIVIAWQILHIQLIQRQHKETLRLLLKPWDGLEDAGDHQRQSYWGGKKNDDPVYQSIEITEEDEYWREVNEKRNG